MKHENRGNHRKELAKKNKKIIEDYYAINPTATLKQCKEVTGLSFPSIAKYKP